MAARKQLESALKPLAGVSSEAIRKNKIAECLKHLFKYQDSFAVPKRGESDFNAEEARVCAQVKRKAQYKRVCGKPLNGKMLLSLAIEYAETLSALGLKSMQVPVPLASLTQAIFRITDEETVRQGDEAYEQFKQALENEINDETMPLSDKQFKKIVKRISRETGKKLRYGLCEILKFEEVLYECERFNQRVDCLVEEKKI